jgi:catalase-peroxidase
MTNGIEGSWVPNPTTWDNDYLTNLFKFEWKQTKSPAGALQWEPTDPDAPRTPDAHIPGKTHPLMMMTSDIALKTDPVYREICQKFLDDFDYFTLQFSKAWYKLTHRDMGPKERYAGPEKKLEDDLIWQDPIPSLDHPVIDEADIAALKAEILGLGHSVSDLAFAAFSSASTFRKTDKRGGANGARIALAPQKDWAVNRRAMPVIESLKGVMAGFNGRASGGKKVSLADLIVLGGCAAVEKAAQAAGASVTVPFVPGRMDTTDALTDAASFEWLKPVVDGFRNYVDDGFAEITQGRVSPEHVFLDRANLLALSAPEWVALTGGLRALDMNHDGSKHGIFTDKVGVLTNDFFTVLTSMDYEWKKADGAGMAFTLDDRGTGQTRFTATRCDLVFGANAQLRAVAEVYAAADGQERFLRDFVKVWDKVMNLGRYDLKN